MTHAVAIVSGGLDSVTLAHWLAAEGFDLTLLAFDYGQRHSKELEFARRAALRLDAAFHVCDLRGLGALLGNNAITGSAIIPNEQYPDTGEVPTTAVPNRNVVMLSIAFALASDRGADAVALGVHGGDNAAYPDCRPAFLRAFESMQRLALDGQLYPMLVAPFATVTKAEIVTEAARLGVPFGETWSCYRGGVQHCGTCATCIDRQQAFIRAGIPDPTSYERGDV